jgi:hypothetical protein
MMNLGVLIFNWRRDSRDSASTPLHLTDDLSRWFSEAEEEAAIRKNLLRLSVEIELSPGDTEILLPAEVFEVRTARIVEGGTTYWLSPTDRYEQDRIFRDWRDAAGRPSAFIHDDTTLTLNRIVESAATLKLETFRIPYAQMADDGDEPEIAAIHHRNLAGWVTYRAFSVPDTDFMDPGRSARGLADFTDYFGDRPDATHRRDNNSNRPHSIKAW